MAKLKKLLKRAIKLTPLPLPQRSPKDPPLATPLDLVTEYVRAWDAKDAEAIGDCFVEDADFINVVGLWWTGRTSIVKAQKFGFARAFADATLTVLKLTQRFIGEDTAVVIAQWQMSGQVDPEGQTVDPRRGVLTATLVRLADGNWLGVNCTNTDIAIAADTNVSRGGTLTATSYIDGPSPADVAASESVESDG